MGLLWGECGMTRGAWRHVISVTLLPTAPILLVKFCLHPWDWLRESWHLLLREEMDMLLLRAWVEGRSRYCWTTGGVSREAGIWGSYLHRPERRTVSLVTCLVHWCVGRA